MRKYKLKFALSRNESGSWIDQFDDNGTIVLRSTEQTIGGGWQINEPARLAFNHPLPEEAFLKAGDIVITKSSGSSLHIGKASLVDTQIEEMRCTFSNFMQRLRFKTTYYPRFIWYFLNSIDGRSQLDRASNTTTGLANLNSTIIGNLELFFPFFYEQNRIAAYLDQQTAKIDRLINLRQRQIALLKEQRAALIQQAVTRGLNPDVPMKDSGLPWLGEIPAHWQKTILAHHTTKIGDGLHGTPQYVDESPYHFVNGNNISGGTVIITSITGCVGESEFQKYRINLNNSTLLMSINGTIGNVAYYKGESIILGKSAAYINCKKSLSRRYLFYFLQSKSTEIFFQLEVTGTTIFNLSLASIRNLPIALPSLDEQEQIAMFIESENEKIDALNLSYSRQITLLTEYRAALIHECVTGQRIIPDHFNTGG